MKPSGLGRKVGIICFWLVLWQLISIAVHNSIVWLAPRRLREHWFPDFHRGILATIGLHLR